MGRLSEGGYLNGHLQYFYAPEVIRGLPSSQKVEEVQTRTDVRLVQAQDGVQHPLLVPELW